MWNKRTPLGYYARSPSTGDEKFFTRPLDSTEGRAIYPAVWDRSGILLAWLLKARA